MALSSSTVAVITGADSGIGRATAVAFAREGAKIAFLYHKDDAGAEETKRLVIEAGVEAISLKGDVGKEEDVERLFSECERAYGPATILVNDAGVDGSGDHVRDMDLATWERTLRTNLTGPFLCAKRFLKSFRAGGERGRIVNVTSVHEEVPRAGAADYCATKGGLRNLTRCLSLELAEKGVSVVNAAPGMVLTPMNQRAIDDPAFLEKQVQSIPVKRAAEPEEVAGLIRYLCSKEADYATGTTFFLDGGLMMNLGQGA